MRHLLFALLLVLPAACGVGPKVDEASSGPFPENYREIVQSYIRTSFVDPYSVRGLAISKPVHAAMNVVGRPAWTPAQQGWLVCIRANAKNRMGGYTGLKTTALLINNGQVVDTDDAPGACGHVDWPPL